jgi:nucleotide-binding universal stress UspA family protein
MPPVPLLPGQLPFDLDLDLAHPEELGLFIAVVVVALIGIYFLLRITLGGARSLGNAVLPPKAYKRVLLPAAPSMGYSEEAVTLACRLAGSAGGGASVLLAYIIEVPRILPPDAAMPEEEAEAERVLARAAEAVKKYGLPARTQVRKARATVEETLRALRDENADLLVLMIPPDARDPNTPHPFSVLTTELARRAPCEVVLARAVAA